MRTRFLCLAVASLMVCTIVSLAKSNADSESDSVPSSVVTGNSQFATDLYAEISEKENETPEHDGNLLVSPYSVSTALAMTFAGAKRQTEAEMAEVMHFNLPQQQLHPAFAQLIAKLDKPGIQRPYQLSVANRLWGQQDYRFLAEFLQTTRQHYGAELAEVDFVGHNAEARKTINRWVEEQTQEKIKDLIQPPDLTHLTRLVLTNAIYFKGDWKHPFDKNETRPAPFSVAPGQQVESTMMHQERTLKYAQLKDFQILELPYAGNDLSMIVLLPQQVGGLTEIEKALTPKNLEQWMRRLRATRVSVFLPKFKMTCRVYLEEVLASMGMKTAFDRTANFSGMTGGKDLYISKVIHKAFIDVNEEGTEAAAATAVVMARKGPPRPTPVFRADRPFLFVLRDNQTGSILFMGRLVNPRGDE